MTERPDKDLQGARARALGGWAMVAADLVWLVQAAALARGLGGLLTAPGDVPVWGIATVLLLAALVRTALVTFGTRSLSQAAEAQITALRDEIVVTETRAAAVSGLGGAGAIAALAGEKAEALRPYLMRYHPARMRTGVIPLVILALAAWHSWAVALVLAMAGPLIPVFMALVGWSARAASERQMAEVGSLSDLLADRLAALSDLRLIGAGEALVDGFAQASDGLRQRSMAVLKIAFLSSTVLELFAALGVAMVAIWVGFTLLGDLSWGCWGRALTPQAGIFLLLLAPEFFQPLRDLAAAWHDRAAADAVLGEVDAWREDDRPERPVEVAERPVWNAAPSIVMSGLAHRGLHWPDLTIGPGDSLALMGPSGSGKTTLLRILAGLDQPESGAVVLDGVSLDAATGAAWRRRIGWMPQAPHFVNASLRHNIGFGDGIRPGVIATTRLEGVIAGLPRGALTRLGERGAGLSGGEARRVTLARALNPAPDVLLADEPTADLDAQTAQAIAEGLLDFARAGGTLIVATHDPALAARLGRTVRLGDAT